MTAQPQNKRDDFEFFPSFSFRIEGNARPVDDDTVVWRRFWRSWWSETGCFRHDFTTGLLHARPSIGSAACVRQGRQNFQLTGKILQRLRRKIDCDGVLPVTIDKQNAVIIGAVSKTPAPSFDIAGVNVHVFGFGHFESFSDGGCAPPSATGAGGASSPAREGASGKGGAA